MSRSIRGAVAVSLFLATGVSAQAPGRDTASAPGMMQQMQARMQGMHQMMQMHGGRDGAQTMQGAPSQTCIMSGPQVGLSALLLGSLADLALTETQRSQLQEILASAQRQALGALTAEQRLRLEAAPAQMSTMCPRAEGGAAGTR